MSSTGLANFIQSVFWVYSVLIIIRIVFSWIGIPSQKLALAFFRAVYDVTEPYLGIFRRLLPPMGGFDFSPIIALLVLNVLGGIIGSLVKGY